MPSTTTIPLVSPLYQLLVIEGLDNLTVRALRDRYLHSLGVPVSSFTAREAYRVVYRQLAMLARHQLVIKHRTPDGPVRYQKTAQFHEARFVPEHTLRRRHRSGSQQSRQGCLPLACDVPHEGDVIAALRHTAYQYQADLQAAIGESEEYQRLAQHHPALKTLFEVVQREATDKRAKLSGQSRAIETVILQHARTLR